MCLIVFAYKTHPDFDLILSANRDEFRNRCFKSAHIWGQSQKIMSGIDLTANGTWTGISESGRIAVITNYRDKLNFDPELTSRGELATNFLDSDITVNEYLITLKNNKDNYNGYNILFGDTNQLVWYCNKSNEHRYLEPGIYGLSNAFLDTPWPKLIDVKSQFTDKIHNNKIEPHQLMSVMLKKQCYPESDLPDTGIDKELEIGLSPIFVGLDGYGTVLTTLIYLGKYSRTLIEYKHLDHKKNPACCYSSKLLSLAIDC